MTRGLVMLWRKAGIEESSRALENLRAAVALAAPI